MEIRENHFPIKMWENEPTRQGRLSEVHVEVYVEPESFRSRITVSRTYRFNKPYPDVTINWYAQGATNLPATRRFIEALNFAYQIAGGLEAAIPSTDVETTTTSIDNTVHAHG